MGKIPWRYFGIATLNLFIVLIRHGAVHAGPGAFELLKAQSSILECFVCHLKEQSVVWVDCLGFYPVDSEEFTVEYGRILVDQMNAGGIELDTSNLFDQRTKGLPKSPCCNSLIHSVLPLDARMRLG